MKLCLFILSILLIVLSLSLNNIFAQESKMTFDELKAKVEGIDKNVNNILNDITGIKKLKITGFVQFQFEKTESGKGFNHGSGNYSINPYDSTDKKVQARYRIRRNFIKLEYNAGMAQLVAQMDFSNEKYSLKDAYISITDPWLKYFSLRTGVFYRPSYDVQSSPANMETLERTYTSSILYPGERDLGAMLTVNPDKMFNLQLAAFNNTYGGQTKQFYPNFNSEPFYYMARLTKDFMFKDIGLGFSIGGHARIGNVVANTNKIIESENNSKIIDTTSVAKGDKIARNWFGLEAQLYIDVLDGIKLAGEYLFGSNIDEESLDNSTKEASPIRKRDFSGFYAVLGVSFLDEWMLAGRYESFNPNTKISEDNIIDAKDLSYSTVGFGIHNTSFTNVRLSLWYDMNMTQKQKTIMINDPVDNLLTLRVQFKY